MTNLVRLGGASEGAYEDEELLAAVAQLPSHHRAVFDRQMNFLREIDYGEAQMSSMGLAKCVAPDWFGVSPHAIWQSSSCLPSCSVPSGSWATGVATLTARALTALKS